MIWILPGIFVLSGVIKAARNDGFNPTQTAAAIALFVFGSPIIIIFLMITDKSIKKGVVKFYGVLDNSDEKELREKLDAAEDLVKQKEKDLEELELRYKHLQDNDPLLQMKREIGL